MKKAAAILTIRNASKMDKQGKQDIAKWLNKQAKGLIKDGIVYAPIFTARYLYESKEKA